MLHDDRQYLEGIGLLVTSHRSAAKTFRRRKEAEWDAVFIADELRLEDLENLEVVALRLRSAVVNWLQEGF
ncbi:MAG TPA: hypothetical protein VHC22_32380 [Pirellulales bacterium]|nr:hypothetical protein [Pirellulales bacterium]